MGNAAVLPQGVGYGVVVGIGFFFALLMAGVSWVQNRYTAYSTKTSEEFNTASRNVKAGLIASGVVSAWTWAATLLQSSTVAYSYGVSGPFWVNAAGATVQIFMFSVLGVKVKQNAPKCHTFLEIVYARYGATTHIIFVCFALATNILVASQLLLGGSAVVTALTGMNVYAATWLIPTGVTIYVVLGGLRATFLCDFSHTIIVMIIILYFMFNTYATSDLIGSPRKMYDLLKEAAVLRPVEANQDGEYLTLKSNYGLVFGVVNLCSGMGTVFLDQGYWQRAIASRPTTAVRAYILGGFAWFAIPFGFATTMGLAAVALTNNPKFPTYPNHMSSLEVSSGLAAAYGAETLLGKNGAVALLITLFMAVTSSSSSELIGVSSILTFDVYKTYFKPQATPQQLILVSHCMIVVFAIVMATFATIWNVIGISLGWLFLVMGLLIGGAVFPAAFTVTWRGQTRLGTNCGCIVGLMAGIAAWLAQAKVQFGHLTVDTTGASYPTLAGNMAGVLTGLIVTLCVSYVKPDNFDWAITRGINSHPHTHEDDLDVIDATATASPSVSDDSHGKGGDSEKTPPAMTASATEAPHPPLSAHDKDVIHDMTGGNDRPGLEDLPTVQMEDKEMLEDEAFLDDPKALKRAFVVAMTLSCVLSFLMDFLIPIPMFLSHYVFSYHFFYAWVVISFLWVFAALFICGILPVWETRRFWFALVKEIFAKK